MSIAFKAYHRTHLQWDGFEAVHGIYDGLSTGLVRHQHLQVLVPLAGRIQLTLPDGTHLLGPERAVVLDAGLAHEASTLGGAFEFLALNAPAGWLEALARTLGAPASPAGALLLSDPGVWLQARQLAVALDGAAPTRARFLALGAEQLGLYALTAAGPAPAHHGVLERAVAIILERHGGEFSVEGLARELAISPRQLERCFRARIGRSPRRFLIDVRLAAARELLARTALPVEAIARQVGFGDPSHFTRTFREAMGVAPGAYRRERQCVDVSITPTSSR